MPDEDESEEEAAEAEERRIEAKAELLEEIQEVLEEHNYLESNVPVQFGVGYWSLLNKYRSM